MNFEIERYVHIARAVLHPAEVSRDPAGGPGVLDFFKFQEAKGHLTRMHSVLRANVDAQRKARS